MVESPNKQAKFLPHNIEAEQALLGSLFIDQDALISAVHNLQGADFYSDSNRDIFAIIVDLNSHNKSVDLITISDALEKAQKLDTVGGLEYITMLTNVVPSAASFKHYLEIVKRDSVLRKLIKSGQNIIENSFESSDKNDALSFAEKEIFALAQNEEETSLEPINPSLKCVLDKFNLLQKDQNAFRGLPTGFADFDTITNGLQKSDLILLAARPGVGKTSFAMNIACNAAINNKSRVAIFSLEMPRTQLSQRALCSVACVSMERALKGQMNEEEWIAILSANKSLADANIFIDDSSLNTPIDILSKCRRLKRESGLDLVLIDYLQLMTSGNSKNVDNRQQEISEITRYLKIAARELDVPILVLSQLSRAVETRKDHRPVLSDLRESGSIEQDADIVLFIYKADMYNDVVNEDEPGVCEIIVAKHRNGPQGTFKLRWVGEYTTFIGLKDQIKRNPTKQIANNDSVAPIAEGAMFKEDEPPFEISDETNIF